VGSDSDFDRDCVQQCLDTDTTAGAAGAGRRSLLVHEDDADLCGCECDSDESHMDGSAAVDAFYGLLLGASGSESDSSDSDSNSAYCRGLCRDFCSLTPGALRVE
jgi:hypothetical protein